MLKSIDSLTQNFKILLKDVEANTLGISKYVAVQEKLGTTFNNTTKQITFLEQRNKGLNKTFGISSEKAADLGERYDFVAKSLNLLISGIFLLFTNFLIVLFTARYLALIPKCRNSIDSSPVFGSLVKLKSTTLLHVDKLRAYTLSGGNID